MLVTPSPAPSPELPLSLFPMDLLGLGTVEVVVEDCTGMALRLHFIIFSIIVHLCTFALTPMDLLGLGKGDKLQTGLHIYRFTTESRLSSATTEQWDAPESHGGQPCEFVACERMHQGWA